MKTTLNLLLCFIAFSAFGRNSTSEKLCEVNKCWREQKDVTVDMLPVYRLQTETDWIQMHLALVESTLRKRNTDGLTPAARQNRLQCLDYLHQYMVARRFPLNEDYSYRTPIFIDKHDNFCAVGYLIKASGYEHISRKIAANTNLAYVREMNYPELAAWASQSGFTTDELAWIQPGYWPTTFSRPVGNGVDGEVNELYVETATNRLFVGGKFINVDGSIAANNVAYLTKSGTVYTWHNMGDGVNGQVNAITAYSGNIFVAGSFSMASGSPANNVAYWDGTAWHGAGCITGTVNDLVVYAGSIYAAGSFDVCGMPNVNFAKWNGTVWQPLPGLDGRINTMEVMGTTLLLGGAFSYGMSTVNAIKWDAVSGFQPFTNPVKNEVKDFEFFAGNIYAGCRHTHATDSVNLLLKLIGNTWVQAFSDSDYMLSFYPIPFHYDQPTAKRSFNALCAESGSLSMGGQFEFMPMIGIGARNAFNMTAPGLYGTGNWFITDSAINKIVLFSDHLIAGGKFKKGYSNHLTSNTLNGIARRPFEELSVNQAETTVLLNVYPNPLDATHELSIENNFNATRFTLRDVSGKLISEGSLNSAVQRVTLPQLPTGIYLVDVYDGDGAAQSAKVSVE